jgi:hypothetical protein
MITFIFLNGNGNPIPIGKTAANLGLKVRDLKTALSQWEQAQYSDEFSVKFGSYSYIFSQPDLWDISTITKRDKNQRMILRVKLSLELTM